MQFIPSLELAYRAMPHKKWFILVDDDTYLIYPSLNSILGHFDPSMPHCKCSHRAQRFRHAFLKGPSKTVPESPLQTC